MTNYPARLSGCVIPVLQHLPKSDAQMVWTTVFSLIHRIVKSIVALDELKVLKAGGDFFIWTFDVELTSGPNSRQASDIDSGVFPFRLNQLHKVSG